MITSKRGFTLIELLIVIVVIAILAGVLVTIINPVKQQNQANDATIRAMINKIVLSTSSFVSGYAYTPNEGQFFGSLQTNVNEMGGSACTIVGAPDYTCLFSVNGINLPPSCNGTNWTGTTADSGQCYFRYYSGNNLPQNGGSERIQFRLYAKSSGVANTVFIYDNKEGGRIWGCDYDIDDSEVLETSGKCEIF